MARPGLTQHRKFRRLARALGSPLLAMGALELLWSACYEAGEDYVGTATDIEALIGWTGEAGLVARAMADAGMPESHDGFIEIVGADPEPTYRVHDLWHHAPDYVAKRRRRELERRARLEPTSPERRAGTDRRTAPHGGQWRPSPDRQTGDGRTPAPAPAPAPHTAPDGAESAETSSAPSSRGSIASREGVFLEFPTSGSVTSWALSEAQVAEWARLYEGLDVAAEARKALAWIRATPGHRKTAGGMTRFLVNWLNRAVDRGGSARSTTTGPSSRPPMRHWTQAECPHTPLHFNAWQCQRATDLERVKKAGVA